MTAVAAVAALTTSLLALAACLLAARAGVLTIRLARPVRPAPPKETKP